MGSEIAMQRARLADKKRTLEELNLRMKSSVSELRNILDPYAVDFTTLRMNVGLAEWSALFDAWEKACELKKQIAAMERDLNG